MVKDRIFIIKFLSLVIHKKRTLISIKCRLIHVYEHTHTLEYIKRIIFLSILILFGNSHVKKKTFLIKHIRISAL